MYDFVSYFLLLGALGTGGGSLPFWATAQQWDMMPERSGAMICALAKTDYDPSKTFQWRWGASVVANTNEFRDFNARPAELYAGIRWKVLSLDLGMKNREQDFIGASRTLGSLSATGGHLIESGNARAMPGYMLHLDTPFPWTKKHLWVFVDFGDYWTLDSRRVQKALVHRTRFGLRGDIGRASIILALDHYTLWGGISPDYGQVPQTFANYFRIITGRSAIGNNQFDNYNALGDHGGSELIRFDWRGDGWKISALHEIPYADKSGMMFYNFPDGSNTIAFSFERKDRWVSDIVYEFYYTMCQSGWRHDPEFDEEGNYIADESKGYYKGGDDYFNNYEYQTGWTYFGRAICSPLFTVRPENPRIRNNRIKAHHVGLSGMLFRKFPYKLMLTYSRNYGTYGNPYVGESIYNVPPSERSGPEIPLHQFSCALMAEFPIGRGLEVTGGLFGDAGQLLGNKFAVTAGLRYIIHTR